ncbi:hypothetical protein CERSUDRAFT_109925 [Gelatoporia subvermispora B]|uniref:Methyltransferase domain-containing protein n=1 Tax=Ceriporiopsis subvermispora (strain B) TaxID=914234 RepID=M2RA78_CERS8|nr:hypothetical protein CERSUDRAFT_109925 [Gelatoporia subvermispora B]
MSILDVGCGPGTITIDLATRVPRGHVIGVDQVPEPLEAAMKLAIDTGIVNASFQQGDALNLPFPDGSFDVMHAHQLVQHIPDPVHALREMRRVARPGGLVAVRESDSSSAAWFPNNPGLQGFRDLCPRVARFNKWDMDAGRKLVSLALQAGFSRENINASAGAWCYSSPEERAHWAELLTGAMVHGSIGRSAIQEGIATQGDVEHIVEGLRIWGAEEDAWYAVLHGEVICHV